MQNMQLKILKSICFSLLLFFSAYAENYEILFERGVSACSEGNLKNAEMYFSLARALKKTPEVLNNLGVVKRKQNKDDEACELFAEAIRTDELYENAYVNYGLICLDKKQWKELIAISEKLYSIEKNSYFALYGLGYGYYRLREYKKAEYFLELACEYFPSDRHKDELDYLQRILAKIKHLRR